MLFLLFLAVTSAVSTEQVAVSNILTYDIYATYINKNPTEKQILWVSRVTIAMYCVVMGGISTAFYYIGVSMGYLYVLMVSPRYYTSLVLVYSAFPVIRADSPRGALSDAPSSPSQCASHGRNVMEQEPSQAASLDSAAPSSVG